MATLDKPLTGVTVVIIDMSETASIVQDGFVSAGAKVIMVCDERSVAAVDPSFVPDVVILNPGSYDELHVRRLAHHVMGEPDCVDIFYDDVFADENYTQEYSIHRSRPVEAVVATAISGLAFVTTRQLWNGNLRASIVATCG